MMSKSATNTAGLLLRAGLLGLALGIPTQLLAHQLGTIVLGFLWLGGLALLLLTARRTNAAVWLGLAGALLYGVGTVAYFGTHLAILDLGWGPANTADLAHTLDLAGIWRFFKPEIRQWILPLSGAGFLVGLAFAGLTRYLPRREAAHAA